MLNSISIGKFYNVKSLIHKMNSTIKIICTVIFLSSIVLANDLYILSGLIALTLLVILFTKVPISLYLKQVMGLKYLVLFLGLIYLLNGYSLVIFAILIIKLLLLVVYAAILTLTTKPTEITIGLEEFLSPLKLFKLPIAELAMIISLALRFIPTIMEQAHRVLKALAARGIDYYNAGLKTKISAIRTLLIPMFILSFKRSDQLADAMDVRLYNYSDKRTSYNVRTFGFTDFLMLIFHLGVLCYIVFSKVGWL